MGDEFDVFGHAAEVVEVLMDVEVSDYYATVRR